MINTQTISVTTGEAEYTWPVTITEATGKDINGDTVKISLGSYDKPGTWQNPADRSSPTDACIQVRMLVNNTVEPGNYWVWVQIVDSPETVQLRAHRVTVN